MKIKRQRIAEDIALTDVDIGKTFKKTDGVCAHCGRRLERTAENISRYIPLSRGGLNQDFNYIPLCADCAKGKADYIISPEMYLKYLQPEEAAPVKEYFDRYLNTFSYFSNNDLIGEDVFYVKFDIDPGKEVLFKNMPSVQYAVKKAAEEDLDDVIKYYAKYLKKRDCLDGKEYAEENIREWFDDGCLYFVKKNGEIKLLIVFTIERINIHTNSSAPNINYSLIAKVFPYYVRPDTGDLIRQILHYVPEKISRRQKIEKFPIVVEWLYNETLQSRIGFFAMQMPGQMNSNERIVSYINDYGGFIEGYTKSEVEKINNFFSQMC